MDIKGFVWLVDDCALRRASLQRVLVSRGVEVGAFASPAEFLAQRPACGVVLVHDSADAIWSLKAGLGQASSGYLQIAYSNVPDWRRAVSAMRSGALDYFEAEGDPDEIVAKIISVQIAHSAGMAAAATQEVQQDKFSGLSKREKQVFDGVIAGLTNRAIADTLGISFRTVEIHRANMLRKIGARNSAEAFRISYEAKGGEKLATPSPELARIPPTLGAVPVQLHPEKPNFSRPKASVGRPSKVMRASAFSS
jgi:FixJ family two-component response regulator